MLLTLMMFVLEAIEEVFYGEHSKKMKPREKIFKLLVAPIWPVFTSFKTSCKQFHAETISENPKKEKEAIKKLTNISNRAHLIEVCMESSIQPLVQLHVILTQVICQNITKYAQFDWVEALTAFWKKDMLTIFDLTKSFNPQVSKL